MAVASGVDGGVRGVAAAEVAAVVGKVAGGGAAAGSGSRDTGGTTIGGGRGRTCAELPAVAAAVRPNAARKLLVGEMGEFGGVS